MMMGDVYIYIDTSTVTHVDCIANYTTDDSCVMTRSATFYQTLISQQPAFGFILFYGTCAFLLMFFLSSCYSISVCNKARRTDQTPTRL